MFLLLQSRRRLAPPRAYNPRRVIPIKPARPTLTHRPYSPSTLLRLTKPKSPPRGSFQKNKGPFRKSPSCGSYYIGVYIMVPYSWKRPAKCMPRHLLRRWRTRSGSKSMPRQLEPFWGIVASMTSLYCDTMIPKASGT